ncbi:membrane protein [Vreelandella olivaria]|uniref:Membrane protein n=1 Tax=Vreelandella olivaria TaxID=390919 RepID=A0ABN5WR11_9GAMM|nr:membrane protein [Halomonas olivaria]
MLDKESESPLDGQVVNREQSSQPDTTMAMVIYALYLASFILGFTSIIGVVIAYVYKGKGPVWLDEHYRYQIRTFWIGLVYGLLCLLLTPVLLGFLLMLPLAVWLIIRCVKGFKGLQEKRAPSNVDTWLI